MEIKYLGHASFFLKGKTGAVVTDPFDPQMVGIKFPSITADIVTVSHDHQDHSRGDLVGGSPLVINLAGEYEKQKIRVYGFNVFHDEKNGKERGKNILFKIEMDDVCILHCGDLGHLLSDEAIEEIGEVDVLLVPVGGFYTIGADQATAIVKEIEPSIVIPMHYNNPKLNQEAFGKLAPISDFLTKMGVSAIEPVKKLVVKKEEMKEEIKTVIFDIQ